MSILNKAAVVEEMIEDRMPAIVATYLGGKMPSERALWNSLVAAEAEVARKLGIWLEPTEVFPVTQPTAEELAALDGKPYVVEPGYDMEGGMLGSFQWASIRLAQRPLIKLHSVKFVYPTISAPVYDVPLEWVYPDYKAGLLQFTPKPTSSGMAPSVLGASIMARGGAVPQMIRIRYTAGLAPNHPSMPDVHDLIMRVATLRHLKFMPQSSSISADGLSQSKSLDVGKFHTVLNEELASLRERLLGPIWSAL
ncbi:hypothetical protein LXA47_19350 [Massilia sp. P8910]|uniref:hypothetical protein n=1 Tax=Massilia antarctica TaxID=2765360 RepID=UPI001E2F15BD|nr:hypothetical protein [Massilia antarctica]MCE3605744.1 hypothetical protein [Massilia antarctica]